MERRLAMVVGFVCLVSSIFANGKDTYLGLLKAGKMPELKAHLDDWAARAPDDPEMYIG